MIANSRMVQSPDVTPEENELSRKYCQEMDLAAACFAERDAIYAAIRGSGRMGSADVAAVRQLTLQMGIHMSAAAQAHFDAVQIRLRELGMAVPPDGRGHRLRTIDEILRALPVADKAS